MSINSRASAQWQGGLKDGKGTISTGSGALSSVGYGFATRFEGQKGLNPEELIGAAHASCFSMAVSAELGRAGITPKAVRTQATVTLTQEAAGFAVTESHLDVTVEAPGADRAKVQAATEAAKVGCPISKLLKANVTLTARYEV